MVFSGVFLFLVRRESNNEDLNKQLSGLQTGSVLGTNKRAMAGYESVYIQNNGKFSVLRVYNLCISDETRMW